MIGNKTDIMGPPPLSQRVVQRIADAEDTDPAALDPPLHAAVNTDALDALFDATVDGSPREQGTIQFPHQRYQVTVTAEGDIQLHDSE